MNYLKKKKSITKPILKRGYSDRAYYLQNKRYRILSDVFRNKLRKYNKISDIVSGLVNYKIMSRL